MKILKNTCYDECNITFNEYLYFLYFCYKNKQPNVNNLNIYNNIPDCPIWFGNCSMLTLNITDSTGQFCSHIMSQKYAIENYINIIIDKSKLNIIEINDLYKLNPNMPRCNVKDKLFIKKLRICRCVILKNKN